jgi:hypothetical protein
MVGGQHRNRAAGAPRVGLHALHPVAPRHEIPRLHQDPVAVFPSKIQAIHSAQPRSACV